MRYIFHFTYMPLMFLAMGLRRNKRKISVEYRAFLLHTTLMLRCYLLRYYKLPYSSLFRDGHDDSLASCVYCQCFFRLYAKKRAMMIKMGKLLAAQFCGRLGMQPAIGFQYFQRAFRAVEVRFSEMAFSRVMRF